ncbi:MAG: RNA-binding protein [Patescibacteria group bacterium]|jgi:hypothetical protein
MASPKVRIDFTPSWFGEEDAETKIRELLSELGIETEEVRAIRYPDTGKYKGELYITLPEKADADETAELLNGQEIIEGHRLVARPATFKPAAESADELGNDGQPPEGSLPRM